MAENLTIYSQDVVLKRFTTTGSILLLPSTEEYNHSLAETLYDDSSFSKAEENVIGATYLTMATVGFVLNALTICIVGFGRNVGKEVKIQMINLAIVDVLMSGFALTRFIMERLHLAFVDNLLLCKFVIFLEYSSHYVSLLCAAAISLERFVIIYFPFRASQYRCTHKLLVVGLVWVCGSLPAFELVAEAGFEEYNGVNTCVETIPESYRLRAWFWLVKYLLPICIIIASYALVFTKVCIRKRAAHLTQNASNQWRKDLNNVSYPLNMLRTL